MSRLPVTRGEMIATFVAGLALGAALVAYIVAVTP
jgi:hypothetical protein